MPDPLRQTISATESAALFDVSPYTTRWMLYQRFANGLDIEGVAHGRMDWGLRIQPLVIEHAARELGLEIIPNKDSSGKETYVQNGLLGYTADAKVFSPSRGPGTFEAKCVFDYRTWMSEWNGGNSPPQHQEIQIQQQMLVGNGGPRGRRADRSKSFTWGIEAVFVAGETVYFEREPIPKFWDALEEEAERFFDDLGSENEPEPFGSPREHPLLNEVFPLKINKTLDLREDMKLGMELAELARMFEYHRQQRLGHTRGEEAIKMRVRVAAKDNDTIMLPHGIIMRLKMNKTGIGLKVHVPEDVPENDLEPFEKVDLGG